MAQSAAVFVYKNEGSINPQGELLEEFEGGRNAWLSIEEIEKLDKAFEGIGRESLALRDSGMTFKERRHEYLPEHY